MVIISLFVCLILIISVKDGEFRVIAVDKREKAECNWLPPNQDYWNGQGCRMCSDCSLLGLYTKRQCDRHNDADCEERCMDKDAVFNKVTQLCDPPQKYAVSTSTEIPGTSSTKYVVKSETARPRQDDYKTLPMVIGLTAVGVLGLIALVVVMVIVCTTKNRKCLKNQHTEKTSVMGEDVPMNKMAGRPLPAPPSESGKDPSTEVTDALYSKGVQYTHPQKYF